MHCCVLAPAQRSMFTNRASRSGSYRNGASARSSNLRAQRLQCKAVSQEFKIAVDKFINENKVVAFIKGNKDFPQCGFSNTVVQILNRMEVPYETVDILQDEMLRAGMKEYSQWPTFPQVYINGEFYGGCDIMLEAYQNGVLKEDLERAMLE